MTLLSLGAASRPFWGGWASAVFAGSQEMRALALVLSLTEFITSL